MTAFQNDERFCRKSSVYNQTGQTYFQQLSAYNHMSAHLRRVLLAPCIVDSRNKRYSRNKGLGSGRFSSRSKSLDKICTQEDIIDGVVYDTQHHPLDVLRKSLECSPECHREIKEVGDACGRCNVWSSRSRAGVTSCTIAQRMPINSEADRTICRCLHLQPCKPCSTPALKRVSPKSSRLSGGSRRIRAGRTPLIADRREWKRSSSDRSRTIKAPPSRSNIERTEPSYAYESSFESSSENSTAPDSPILKISEISRPESPAGVVTDRETNNKTSDNVERADEAKYAKFIYDITQEITINGLYTDDDLHMIFKKHIDMNSDILDRNKMQSEIHRLKMALNVRDDEDDEEVNDIERFVGTGKFDKFSMEQTPKIYDEHNVEGKMRHNEASIRFGELRRPKSSHGKNTVVLVDPNPELLITEQDVVLTLREMKLDPRQIQSICKSLQKRSREISPSQPVQNYSEISSFKRGQTRSNSPIDSRYGSRTIDVYHSYTDRKLQNASTGPRKNQPWQCRCTDSSTAEESRTKIQPDMVVQTAPGHSRDDRIHVASAISQLNGISEPSISTRSIRSTESKKIYAASENHEKEIKEENISRVSSLGSSRLSQESLRTFVKHVSNNSFHNENEDLVEEEEKGRMAKLNMRKTAMIQAENRRENDSSIESIENRSDEEQERTLNMKMRTSPSNVQSSDRIMHEPKSPPVLKLEPEKESKNEEIGKPPNTRNFHNSSPLNEEADIMFVSHSRFLNNLRREDVSSLPDISERSEGITEEVATGENVTNSREKLGILTEHTSQVVDNESSEISENIDALEVPSLSEVTEGKKVQILMPKEREIPATEENSLHKLSSSSILQVSGESENDEDSDENKRVVVAALKPSSSSVLIPKIIVSNLSPGVEKEKNIVVDKATLSPELSPRISENEDCKSIDGDESPKNSAEKARLNETYSLEVDRRLSTSNSVNKSSDTSSIETDIDQQEILNSTSEIQVEEEKSDVPSGATNSKAENEDEESRKFYELAKQSERNSMTIQEISKSRIEVYRPERDSSHSERNLQKCENSKKQKGKQQIRYTRFSRLIGKGNRQRKFDLEGTSETSGKKLRITEKEKEQQRPNFPDEIITTASDISFLRKQNLNDSAQLSIENSFEPTDHQSEPTPSNSREIERYVARSRSLGNSYSSMYLKKESTSGILKQKTKVTPRRQNVNQSEKSISKRMKAAVGKLIKRSNKYTQSVDETNKNLTRSISSGTTADGPASGESSPPSDAAETDVSSILAINSQNSSCVCVLTTKKVHRNRTGNCRPDCRGRGFVCDQRCALFNRVLH